MFFTEKNKGKGKKKKSPDQNPFQDCMLHLAVTFFMKAALDLMKTLLIIARSLLSPGAS